MEVQEEVGKLWNGKVVDFLFWTHEWSNWAHQLFLPPAHNVFMHLNENLFMNSIL